MSRPDLLGDTLLDTAAHTFDQLGWMGTTVERVATDANVPLADALNRFPSREHLAVGIFEQVLDRMPEEFTDEVESNASLGSRLYFLLAHELRILEPHKAFVQQALLDSLNPLSQLGVLQAGLVQRYCGLVSEQIQVARGRGEVSFLVIPSLATSGFWLLRGQVLLYWLADSSHGSERTHAQANTWVDLFVRCLSLGLTDLVGPILDSTGAAFSGLGFMAPAALQTAARKRTTHATPVTILEGAAGERLFSTFLIRNTRGKLVKTAFLGSRFFPDTGASVPLSFTFEPETLVLSPSEEARVRLSVVPSPDMTASTDYRGEVVCDQIPEVRIPLVVRRRGTVEPAKKTHA